jgi:ketosteroid isomerase-like protein
VSINLTTDVIEAYYATWQNGIDSFDEAGLRRLLAADFVYDGPIAGRRPGAESFVQGLKAFVRTLESMRVLSQLRNKNEAAFLYDCDVSQPAGTFRFAEFLRLGDGQIHEVRLVFDATEFRKAAAAATKI